jgi:two-component system OmpR family sensor kinase
MVFRSFTALVVPWANQVIERYERLQLLAAANILQLQGPASIAEYSAKLPSGERLEVLEGARQVKPEKHEFSLSQLVHTPSGPYTLVYRSTGEFLFSPEPAGYSDLPLKLLGVNFLAVSIFSLLIARYLDGPIQKLRAGLERVAEGDLTVRLSEQLASRRDELADVARDFDLMAERLQQLLASRERLLHDVSHEFRSPLTRLLLAVDLAHQNPERSLASLERIEYEAKRLNDMVGELLTVSRAEFTAAKSETYFAIADLLSTVIADVTFEAQAMNVKVETDIPAQLRDGDSPVIKGSPELLRKGIENVLRNAVKASQSGQTVTVRLEPPEVPGGKLRIEISDQGPGVPDAALERIFEPFVRLEGQPQGGGFGLGLAIADSAARAHNGAIWATNSPNGFTVVFELSESRLRQ